MSELNAPESRFITTEPPSGAGKEAEKRVWEAAKHAFRGRSCLGYWRYPIFAERMGERRKEPDVLIADRKLGLIIIEVKGLGIDNIVSIDGHRWNYRNFYAESGSPYQQAEGRLRALMLFAQTERSLFNVVAGRTLVALPHVRRQEWDERGFADLPSVPPVLLKEDLGKQGLLRRVKETTPLVPGEPLAAEQWELLQGVLSGTPVHRSGDAATQTRPTTTRQGVQEEAATRLHRFDLKQERIAKQIPPGPQRIRGIAGSGKTVMLCQKAAHMHLKHPDWHIAFVFHTRSLYDQIIEQIDRWMRRFSSGSESYDPSENARLRVLHAWGARDQPGFYGQLCERLGRQRLTFGDVKKKARFEYPASPPEALAQVCRNLLESEDSRRLRDDPPFDAVLVDEGQDLVVADRFKHNGKQPIYHLIDRALRPVVSNGQGEDESEREAGEEPLRRLVWAYDEAQSLDTLKIPSSKEVFGEEEAPDLSGSYPGGIQRSEIMRRCYRTPGPILTAAHALGMGLHRSGGMVAGFTTQDDWGNIGYEVVEGDFKSEGNEIVLRRPPEHSPNPVPELWDGDVFAFETFSSKMEELQALAENVRRNVEGDGLAPSRDLLVIVLGSKRLRGRAIEALQHAGVDTYEPGAAALNEAYNWRTGDPNDFWHEGGVTVTRIHRAKGNEAPMVHVVGAEQVARKESDVKRRNELFVALSRSKGWVRLTGTGDYTLYDEVRDATAEGPEIAFTYSRPGREMDDENGQLDLF